MSFKIDDIDVTTRDVAIYSMMVFSQTAAAIKDVSPAALEEILNKLSEDAAAFENQGLTGIAALIRHSVVSARLQCGSQDQSGSL